MTATAEVYIPTPKDYLDVLFRRRWPYFVGLAMGALLVFMLQSQQLTTFESESMVEVIERDKGNTFVAGLSQTSNFTMRWGAIQHQIFNRNIVARHTRLFSGIDKFTGRVEGSLEDDVVNDKARYEINRLVPYDETHDRWITLTPYQWWLIRHELDKMGWVPPVAEGSAQRQLHNRLRIAQWFQANIFQPMEDTGGGSAPLNLHWPEVDGRMVPGKVVKETGFDARLGSLVPVEHELNEDDRQFLRRYFHEGAYIGPYSTKFLKITTLTETDLDILVGKGFQQQIETAVARGLLPNGYKVHFSSNNPRLTRFVVAWAVEMIMRFSDLHQYEEIFGSRRVLKRQLEQSMAVLKKTREKVRVFLEENVERYEDSMARYLLDPSANEAPRVGKDNQVPESVVRQAYNKISADLDKSMIRQLEIRAEISEISEQLLAEPELIRKNVTTSNPEYARIESQINDLVAERDELLYTKTPRHPHVTEFTRRIDSLKGVLDQIERNVLSESTSEINPRRTALKGQLSELQAEQARIEQTREALINQKKVLTEDLKKVPEIEQRIFVLKSELSSQSGTVSELQMRINNAMREEQLAYDLARVEYEIKVLPTLPDLPTDKLLIHVGMGIVLTIFAAGIIIFMCEFFDPSIKEISDVNRYLDAAVIGVIPKIPTDAFEVENRRYTPENARRRHRTRRGFLGQLFKRGD